MGAGKTGKNLPRYRRGELQAPGLGRLLCATALSAPLMMPTSLARADTEWIGPGGGWVGSDWFNPGNWTNGVPGASGTGYTYITGSSPAIIDGIDAVSEKYTYAGTNRGSFDANGDVRIINGGSLTAADCCLYLGSGGGRLGSMMVDGAGSVVSIGSVLAVGHYSGEGQLLIQNGGAVDVGSSFYIGRYDDSVGTVTVTGAGSTATGQYGVSVGGDSSDNNAEGHLFLVDGGTVRAGSIANRYDIDVAESLGSTGTLNVGDGGAAGIVDAAAIRFGDGTGTINFNHNEADYNFDTPIVGAGTVNILAGTTIFSGVNSYSGQTTITNGELRAGVAGAFSPNSMFTVDDGTLNLDSIDQTVAGLSGTGGTVALGTATLTVEQASDTAYAGVISGSGGLTKSGSGALTLTGANTYTGGTLLSGGTLTLGHDNALGGSSLTTTGSVVDYADGVNIGNAAIIASNTTQFQVLAGSATHSGVISEQTGPRPFEKIGAGELILTNDNLWTGLTAVSNGTLTFDGGSVTLSDNLIVGSENGLAGLLRVENSGSVASEHGYIGNVAGSTGEVTVNGAGSNWTTSDTLYVARLGDGTLTISDGGVVTNTNAVTSAEVGLGYDGNWNTEYNTEGTIVVTNAGSQWNNAGAIYIGARDKGTLTISDGGVVSSAIGVLGGNDTAAQGIVTVTGGGSQWNDSVRIDIGNGDLGMLTIADGGQVNVNSGNGAVRIAVLGTSTGTLNIGAVSGDTAVAAGMLNAASVQFGSGTGKIVFNHNDGAYDFVANISGSGSVLVENGTTALTGTNTYGGGTTISGGTLQIGDGGTSGSIAGDITNNAALAFNRSDALTFSGQISGAGSLQKLGGGTTTLTGTNSFTGGTTISGGTLQIGDGGTSGSIAGDITNNAALAFNRSDALTFAGSIGGTGSFQKLGAGTTTLTGTNGFTGGTTISGGTLQIGDGGTSGSVTGDITNNAALAFNRSDDVTFGGQISGAGSFQKLGGGTTTLTGINTYNGTTTIDGGILEVATGGSVATSATTVNGGGLVVNGTAGAVNVRGGFLGGAGTVGATVIGSGGNLSPGNSIDTITVNGSLDFAPGSTYRVEVSPGSADRTDVKAIGGPGTANLSGATVEATYEPGSYVAKNYVVVHAEGGVGGEFDGLNGTAPTGFKHSLSYDANNAYLNLTLLMSTGAGQFSGLDENQKGVADALSSYFDSTGGLPGSFATLTKDGLTANAGNGGAAAQSAGMSFGGTFIDTIGGTEFGGAGTGGGNDTSAYAAEHPSPAPERFGRLSYAAEELLGGADAATRAMHLQHRLETGYGERARKPERFSVWGAALGGGISLAGNQVTGSQAVSGSTVGLASGFDWTNGSTRAGLALGASWSTSSVTGLGTANVGNFSAGLRASHDFGPLYLTGALAYGLHSATTTRTFAGETYKAAFIGHSISSRAEAGWRLKTGAVDVAPFVAGRFVSFSNPAYAETGSGAGTFALSYGANTSIEARSELGIRLQKTVNRANGSRTAFSGTLGWAHYFSRGRTVTAGFTNLPGTQFVTEGATGASDTALVSLGVSHRFANGVGLSLDAEGEFGAGTIGYAAKGKISFSW